MSGIDHDLRVTRPDYDGGSLVNLMRSLGDALGAAPTDYPPLRTLDAARVAGARRIALVVIDGLGDELLAHLGAGSALAGLRTDTLTSVYPPTTATAVTSLMTGLAPRQHGLTGWFMHFRQLGAVTAVLPFMPRFARTPLSRAGVPIGALVDCPNFFDRVPGRSLALMPAAIADSDFSGQLCGRAERVPYDSLEAFAARLGAFCAGADGDATYLYAYWSELDHLAHLHGPSSDAVAAHFAALDRALAPVAEACAASGTLLVATADHGFIDTGADERVDLEHHRPLADMLSMPLCGEPRSAYCYVRLSEAGAFEEYVESELGRFATLTPSAALVEDGWYGPGTSHPELLARVGDYTLQMRERYTIRDRVTGESAFDLKGMHGGVAAAEQIVPLMLAGP